MAYPGYPYWMQPNYMMPHSPMMRQNPTQATGNNGNNPASSGQIPLPPQGGYSGQPPYSMYAYPPPPIGYYYNNKKSDEGNQKG